MSSGKAGFGAEAGAKDLESGRGRDLLAGDDESPEELEDRGQKVSAEQTDKVILFNGVEVNDAEGPDVEKIGLFGRVFLTWISGLIRKGYKREGIQTKDLWKLRKRDDPEMLSVRLLAILEEYRTEDGSDFRPYALWKTAFRLFFPQLFVAGCFEIVYCILRFAGPVLLRQLVLELEDGDADPTRGYCFALGLALAQGASTMFQMHSRFLTVQVGLRLKNALSLATFKHVIQLDQEGRQALSDGQVVNLVSTDAPVAVEFLRLWNRFWTAPLLLVGGIIYIYFYVGPAVFCGLGVMVFFVPLSIKFGKVQTRLQGKKMMMTDSRVKTVNEMLQGIKVLKLYAWEKPLLDLLSAVRKTEMKAIRTLTYYRGITMPMAIAMPNIASVVTFGVYIGIGNSVTPANTFAVVSAFNIIRAPFITLPLAITLFTRALVSARRFTNFFALKSRPSVPKLSDAPSVHAGPQPSFRDLQPTTSGSTIAPASSSGSQLAIAVRDASFTWSINDGSKPMERGIRRGAPGKKATTTPDAQETDGGSPFRLEHIDLEIPRGELVAIVGRIGDGKSSLLSALLGEMRPVEGTVQVHGKSALCTQEPFIMNRTVRENILFETPFDAARYNATLEACALVSDLATLPASDLTEIGERGVNLSGGQKARISLARAVYAQPEVIFLDDVLSAVDAHVGKHIFDHCISNEPGAALSGTTRLFVTNYLPLLERVDRIIFMVDGRIADQGTYTDLLESGSSLFDALPTPESDSNATKDSDSDIAEGEAQGLTVEDAFEEAARKASSLHSTASSPEEQSGAQALGKAAIAENTRTDMETTKGGALVGEEARVKGAMKWSTIQSYWLAGTFGSRILALCILLIFLITEGVFLSIDSWLARYSEVDAENPSVSQHTFLTVYFVLTLAFFCILVFRSLVFAGFSVRAADKLYTMLQENVFYLPMTFFWQTPMGRILNRLSKDTNDIDVMLAQQMQWFLIVTVRLLGTMVLVCISVPIFAVALVPFSIIYLGIRELYRRTAVNVQRIESILRSPVFSHLGETLQGVPTLRAFGRTDTWLRVAATLVGLNHRAFFAVEATQIWLSMRLELLGALIVFVAAIAMVATDVDPGLAGLALSYSLNIVVSLQMSVMTSSQVEAKMNAVERVTEYASLPNERALDEQGAPPPKDWPSTGAIRFDDVTLRYRDNLEPALRNMTLDVPAGTRVAIVGATGSGKSTSLVALFRLVNSLAGGRIYIDGVDIASIPVHTLRSVITCIPQDPVLFTSSLRKNLDPFDLYDDEQVWDAIDRSHLRKTVDALPSGLLSPISQGGENLSVGERQLICIARAILRKSKIVLLDEASASLDHQTDALIQESIRSSFPDCTMLVIAHRLDTVVDMDRCLVMHEGRVAEYGTFAELLANDHSRLTMLFGAAGMDRDNYRA
ncbi:ABC transporter ATP-binding protein/permease VMR1 [Hondaea fermentalgiana]|uniref:ABC transporter ATP-binding protein/permease VMR1 n=1 Tax=Hondaea fermentalgiana TaxID=2315210 RepID=A0A2R5G8C8_9STRA|nr:ABC transporter ATP-binding protein/permease VMR1 [Hondaea fermentalgiana]|eukprot:GBG27316.1 ABC transporter ATP-binding protein/permease VMR1 [Hondaea fermentalgiana]